MKLRQHRTRPVLSNRVNTKYTLNITTQVRDHLIQAQGDQTDPRAVAGQDAAGAPQEHVEVDQQYGNSEEQQAQRVIARPGACAHLLDLAVAALNTEAPTISRRHLQRTPGADPVYRIGEVTTARFAITLARVFAGNHDLRGVATSGGALESVRRVITLPPTAQALDPVLAALRQRDDVRDAPRPQMTHDFDRAEGFVPVGEFQAHAQVAGTIQQSLHDLDHPLALPDDGQRQAYAPTFVDQGQGRVGMKARRASFRLAPTHLDLGLRHLAVERNFMPITRRFPTPPAEVTQEPRRQLLLERLIELLFQLCSRRRVIGEGLVEVLAHGVARRSVAQFRARAFQIAPLGRRVTENLPQAGVIECARRNLARDLFFKQADHGIAHLLLKLWRRILGNKHWIHKMISFWSDGFCAWRSSYKSVFLLKFYLCHFVIY